MQEKSENSKFLLLFTSRKRLRKKTASKWVKHILKKIEIWYHHTSKRAFNIYVVPILPSFDPLLPQVDHFGHFTCFLHDTYLVGITYPLSVDQVCIFYWPPFPPSSCPLTYRMPPKKFLQKADPALLILVCICIVRLKIPRGITCKLYRHVCHTCPYKLHLVWLTLPVQLFRQQKNKPLLIYPSRCSRDS